MFRQMSRGPPHQPLLARDDTRGGAFTRRSFPNEMEMKISREHSRTFPLCWAIASAVCGRQREGAIILKRDVERFNPAFSKVCYSIDEWISWLISS